MLRLAATLMLLASAARGEEIRIELLRGAHSLQLGARTVSASGGRLLVDGKASPALSVAGQPLDGRALPGRIDVFVDKGALVAVNTVDLEDYVAAVVSSEVPSSWPKDALEAQAVAARTFAVAQKIAQGPGARAHLRSTVLDQVYKGLAAPSALSAARATAGEVLTFGAAPIAAYFSASCGGRSESGEAGFNLAAGTTPYLHGAEPDEDERPWTVSFPLSKLTAALHGRLHAEVSAVSVAARTPSGRARTVRLGERTLSAVELRQILGYEKLPSLLFDVSVRAGVAVFTGRGSGHGVGLCQWGARERARHGEHYREILAHYYPGAEIRRMY
jgi:stage II sporulation protein D